MSGVTLLSFLVVAGARARRVRPPPYAPPRGRDGQLDDLLVRQRHGRLLLGRQPHARNLSRRQADEFRARRLHRGNVALVCPGAPAESCHASSRRPHDMHERPEGRADRPEGNGDLLLQLRRLPAAATRCRTSRRSAAAAWTCIKRSEARASPACASGSRSPFGSASGRTEEGLTAGRGGAKRHQPPPPPPPPPPPDEPPPPPPELDPGAVDDEEIAPLSPPRPTPRTTRRSTRPSRNRPGTRPARRPCRPPPPSRARPQMPRPALLQIERDGVRQELLVEGRRRSRAAEQAEAIGLRGLQVELEASIRSSILRPAEVGAFRR